MIELPEPVHHEMHDGVCVGYYSAAQLQAYGEACRKEALDAAIKACESVSVWPSLGPKHCIESIKELSK